MATSSFRNFQHLPLLQNCERVDGGNPTRIDRELQLNCNSNAII